MDASEIRTAAQGQSRRSLIMFRGAVEAFTPVEWRRGDVPYLRPAGLALHVVEIIEFYISGKPAAEFSWGHRFGVDWEGGESDQLPDQEALLAYLDEVEANLAIWFDETDLLAPEPTYSWTGQNKLGLAIYTLRHTQHHMAEMALELTRRGLTPPKWR